MYPSEYAYHDDSVSEQESNSANCRRYEKGLQKGVFTEQYRHCDGTQLKLTDSDLGQGQYQTRDYYVWVASGDKQLLFIFPTRVSLTTITLHYYSDGAQGLLRLTFYAVPDDFDVWDAPTTSYPSVKVAAVPPGGEPAGRRNVSINVNFNTKKLLMYKFSSTFALAVSEVEFFTCKHSIILMVSCLTIIMPADEKTTTPTLIMTDFPSLSTHDNRITSTEFLTTEKVTCKYPYMSYAA